MNSTISKTPATCGLILPLSYGGECKKK